MIAVPDMSCSQQMSAGKICRCFSTGIIRMLPIRAIIQNGCNGQKVYGLDPYAEICVVADEDYSPVYRVLEEKQGYQFTMFSFMKSPGSFCC
jgi:hypothetical protein